MRCFKLFPFNTSRRKKNFTGAHLYTFIPHGLIKCCSESLIRQYLPLLYVIYLISFLFCSIYSLLLYSIEIPTWLSGKESTCQCRRCGRHRMIPRLGTSPGGGNGNPSQYSCWKNPVERVAWLVGVQRVAMSQT